MIWKYQEYEMNVIDIKLHQDSLHLILLSRNRITNIRSDMSNLSHAAGVTATVKLERDMSSSIHCYYILKHQYQQDVSLEVI